MKYTSWNKTPQRNQPRAHRKLLGGHSLNHNPSSDGTPDPHRDHTRTPGSRYRFFSHAPTDTLICSRISASHTTCTITHDQYSSDCNWCKETFNPNSGSLKFGGYQVRSFFPMRNLPKTRFVTTCYALRTIYCCMRVLDFDNFGTGKRTILNYRRIEYDLPSGEDESAECGEKKSGL